MQAEGARRDLWVAIVALVALNVFTLALVRAEIAAAVQVSASLGAVWLAIRRGYAVDDLGLSRQAAPAGLRLGAALSAVVVIGVIAIAVIPLTRDFLDDDRFVDISGWRVVYEVIVRIPIATALSEELLFRLCCSPCSW